MAYTVEFTPYYTSTTQCKSLKSHTDKRGFSPELMVDTEPKRGYNININWA